MRNLKKLIEKYEKDMIDLRRDLHQYPELQFEEFRTTEKIANNLEQLKIPYKRTEPTGIIADLKGGLPGKTIALRADMDALPVKELNETLSYKSKEVGKMHACGHDAHTAMLLTAAKVLKEFQDEIKGTVRFIFQPSEEDTQGAKKMIAQGALENVSKVFGLHIWSPLPSGKISCMSGPTFASADIFSIEFKGKGGHGAMPEVCVDAALMASSFVMNIQSIVSRETSPLDPVVVTVGKMDVGTRFNVIAENDRLEGTVRCFTIENRDRVQKSLINYAEQVAKMYNGTVHITYTYGTLPVINNEKEAYTVQKIIQENFGVEALAQTKPTTAGEDFSYYIDKIPGCFALVGCGNKEKDTCWAHHHGRFNIDESTMKNGVELYVQYILKQMEEM